ncbi:MAG: multicopper oxidase family protein, partial [Phaeodactylibacter sp.]|nr:multicopper oxidase family protein [Phaeodactylibacter sp.]
MEPSQVTYRLTASEFTWQLSDERAIQAWGYNEQLPGPVLKAKKGDELIVHFTNNLSEPTLIHWHGIRLPAAMDGTDGVQHPVQPGESFEYRFIVPDAGTFWYHSHANETQQMERGLYGALIVEDPGDPVFDAERVLMIDDMKLTDKGEFTRPGWAFPRLVERHDGREGDTLLINGRTDTVIGMHAGQLERWRFINAASARYFVLHLSGKPFRIIGSDGGLLESAQTATEVLITPGERVDIVAGPFEEGETFAIESLAYDRMTFVKSKRQQYAAVQVGERRPSAAFLPDTLRKIEPLAPQDAGATRKIKLSVGPSLRNGLDFMVNNSLHAQDEPVRAGELQVWEVYNASLMDHPFHLHGFFFQVL